MTGPRDRDIPQQTRAALEELALLVLDRESTQTVLQKVVDLVARVMPAGSDVSMTVVRNDQPTTAAYAGQRARDLDETQYRQGYGPCVDAAIGGQLIEIGDGRTEMRMTQTGGSMQPAGYERAKEGWGGFFDRMSERLAEAG